MAVVTNDVIDKITSTATTFSPFVKPAAWDTVIVAGSSFTTKLEIRGASRSYKWQKKEAAGVDGDTKTYRGKKPSSFEIDFYIWTDDLYRQWVNFSKNFLYTNAQLKPGLSGVRPVQIEHPALQNIGINQVTCDDIGALKLVSDNELMWKATVKLSEFFPEIKTNVTKTPAGAKADPTNIPGQAFDPDVVKAQAALAAAQATATNNALPPPFGIPK